MSEGNGSEQKAASKEFQPRLIFWEVTKGCNLRCVHCRATATELMSPQDLPTAKALDIIDQIAKFGNPILVLSGGEPLYRQDIFQLAEYGTSLGLRVALATKGTLGRRELPEKISTPASNGFRFRWTALTPQRMTRSAGFPAPSTRPFTACATCRCWGSPCRSTPP